MAAIPRTPRRLLAAHQYGVDAFTPPVQTSLSRELKLALHERNLLTAKSRRKVCSMLDGSRNGASTDSINRTGNEADKRSQFRRQAIQEILTSERSYIAQLKVLMQFFVRPLRDRTDLIGTEQYQAVFGQVEMIYSLNAELLQELESDLDNVARAFKRMAPFFKLYSVYAFDYNRSQLILQELTDKNAGFKKFLEANESRPEVQRKLISLLIAPIQRVPRYRLLLQQVVLYSSPSDADFRGLQDSIREVEATVQHLNTVIQDQENTQALLDLQNSLVNRQPNIVQPSRKIVREGTLHKMSGSGTKLRRHCVLMSDIFMYCKCLKERSAKQLVVGALQCCCIFPLKKCRVTEIFPGSFKLTCQGDGIILSADTVANGRAWLAAIKDTIDVHVQCRKTIRKGSSKRAPIRRRQEVKNFESQTEVSTIMMGAATKRQQEFESVFKCAADSDTDLDSTNKAAAATCFRHVNPQYLFKRKRRHSTLTSTVDRTNTALAEVATPSKLHKPNLTSSSPPHTPPIRHWFQPGGASISALAHNSQLMLTSTPERKPQHFSAFAAGGSDVYAAAAEDDADFDPTYGMAAYAHHKCMADMLVTDDADTIATEAQSKRRRADGVFNTNEWSLDENSENLGARAAMKRKRVHFNVVESVRDHTEMRAALAARNSNGIDQPYPFGSEDQRPQAPTLRSRIAGFFASLF